MSGTGNDRQADRETKRPAAPAAAARRHRGLIEGAVVAGEIAATMIGQSKDLVAYSKRVIARPHIVVSASPDAPLSRQPIICERCARVIDSPGIAIMRGRMVTHVRCDRPAATTG